MPNARPTKRKPLKSRTHAPGHAPRFGTKASVVQPSQPLAILDMGETVAQQRDFLASTAKDHSQSNYGEANFRQTGKRDTGLPYDRNSE